MQTVFEGNNILTFINIITPPDCNLKESLMDLSFERTLKIKCGLGFNQKTLSLSLIAEMVDKIMDVKLVV